MNKRLNYMFKHIVLKAAFLPYEIMGAFVLIMAGIISRFIPKKIDIGLGPLPLINNVYHKKVFESCGYTAETFVNQIWHITSEFDIKSNDSIIEKIPKLGRRLNVVPFALLALFRYRCLVIYFNGGPLGITDTYLLWRLEPFVYWLAGIKTIVMPYGADVQVMSRSLNLLFKDVMSKDYPNHRYDHCRIAQKIDLWTNYGSHVIGGCEWVDYMHHWDTLMISHFSIDMSQWPASLQEEPQKKGAFRILHAPNHRNIKGTQHIIDAVHELKNEGYHIELVLAEKRPNHEIRELIRSVDIVVDQIVIGWYAMFAIESMALEKPVICNTRKDLEYLYKAAGLYAKDEEIPLIHACPLTIKSVLIDLYARRDDLVKIGQDGRQYVERHHSVTSIAKTFEKITNDLIGQPMKERG